ncbi:SH3 domain-containing protein [Paenibacillus sp.]|uniref:SH3 domain-containing protein n=1 Tax=Paenibacillus sp. TaxID=58172 RepID=UPI002D3B71D7|nr:SH3 domain-containing protein [Paenibacillus sp.]HZG86054.1 SH3 domain-containing protein [Paenibacillus sp.]
MRKDMRCYVLSLLMAALLLQTACNGNTNDNMEIQSAERGGGGQQLPLASEDSGRIPLVNNEYVPIQDLSEAIGYRTNWNPNAQVLSIGDTDVIFEIAMNQSRAEIDEKPVQLSGRPVLINGKPHVPVSALSELFQREIRYSVQDNHVVVHPVTNDGATTNQMASEEGSSVGMLHTTNANAAVAEVKRTVTLRERPSVQGDKIRYARQGERLDVLENVNRYWLKVRDANGRVGYVSSSSKYVDIKTAPAPATNPPSSNANAAVAEVKRSVTLRERPSVQGDKIRYAREGERLQILENVNRYWLKVRDANGRVGYVSSSSKYVNITGNNANAGTPAPTTPAPATPAPTAPAPATNAAVRNVIDAGMKYLGTPYEFGSSRSNTRTFDCSDFVRQAYIDGAGITLPSNSRTQGDYVRRIGKTTSDWRQLKPGDIMFFMSYKGSRASNYSGINKSSQRITHDGIYIGNGKVLHTYSEDAGGVRVDSFEGRHWEYRFLFGGSVF